MSRSFRLGQGGSFGIAFITTMSERRQDLHQSRVADHLTPSTLSLQSSIQQTAAYLTQHGYSAADSMAAATARFYAELHAQTQLLAFMDCFFVIGVITLIVAPLAILTKNFKVGGKAPEGGH